MKKFLVILFVLQCLTLQAQVNRLGLPFVTNYSAKTYLADIQNWTAVQDARGVMYFGNNSGVLEYDGVQWRIIPVSNGSIVRSLAVDSAGTVFVAAVGEFGYLAPDKKGQLEYVSLSSLLDTAQRPTADVWKVYATKQSVFFSTFKHLYRFDYKLPLKVYALEKRSFFNFYNDGRYYIPNSALGLKEYINDTVKLLPGGSDFAEIDIFSILSHPSRGLLVSSGSQGMYLFTDRARPFKHQAEQTINDAFLYSGRLLNTNTFAFSTVSNGVFTIDSGGVWLSHINKSTGLIDDAAYALYQNSADNFSHPLWAALDQGISKIEYTSPLTRFDERNGLKGRVEQVIRFDGKLYVGTSFGVFVSDVEKGYAVFRKLAGLDYPVWSFCEVRNDKKNILLVGTSNGVYQIQGNNITAIRTESSYYCINQSVKNPRFIWVGLGDGFVVLQNNKGVISLVKKITDIEDEIRSITEDEQGNIWLGTLYNGVIRLKPQTEPWDISFLGEKEGLPTMNDIQVSRADNVLVFATPKGMVQWDEKAQKFIPYTALDASYSDGSKGVFRFVSDITGSYWLSIEGKNEEWLEKAEKQTNGYQVVSVPFKRIPSTSYSCIYPEADSLVWIGTTDGLYCFNNKTNKNYNQPYRALVRKVSLGDEVLFSGAFFKTRQLDTLNFSLVANEQSADFIPKIPYSNKRLVFECAAAYFESEQATQYSYFLQGYDESWSRWTNEAKTPYTNLSEGSYVFRVKARNVYTTESTEASFRFTILPPWYRTWWAYLLYLVSAGIVLWIIVKLNTRRLLKDKERLEGIVRERTAEVVRQRDEISTQKEKVEAAYSNIRMLSEIGQDITATLSVTRIIETVYHNINTLMDAPIFGIGIYNERKKRIEFDGSIENDKKLELHYDTLDEQKLSVICFKEQKEISISEWRKEYTQYFTEIPTIEVGQEPVSIVYLPLTVKDKKIGVLTIQSFKANIYQDYQLNILKNLAVYVGIAVDNADAYEHIEEQKRDITDSINYASYIQGAMLPKMDDIRKALSESFVLFRPRDIVSGDFYWFAAYDDKIIITAADCTGHGVPGAFMSMIGSSYLNQIVNSMGVTRPDLILNELHKKIRMALKQDVTSNVDGMDLALCVVDRTNKKLQYAGANNPMVYIQNGELHQIKADSKAIGGKQPEPERIFTLTEVDVTSPTWVYIFSDGYQDQFGGKQGRKFMIKRMKELFLEMYQTNMTQQREILDTTITNWINDGNMKQIDDILVLGFKLDY